MAVTYWIFDYGGGSEYTFARNPDRSGGDSYWVSQPRMQEIEVIGASLPTIQMDGFNGARRTLRFTAITGTMMRTLQAFYLTGETIENCRDHLYNTTVEFDCFIESFTPTVHPTIGNFPGSGEDTYDLEIVLIKMNP